MAPEAPALVDAPADRSASGAGPARPGRRGGALVLLLLLAVGLGVRLDAFDRSPLAFHATRQYRSFVIARAMHLGDTRAAEDAERLTAEAEARELGDLEPPILERVVAGVWHLTGEELWVPRLLSVLAWMVGAGLAWAVLGRLSGRVAQVVGTGAFLLLPMGVAASRSFQPDALMVVLALGALAAGLAAEGDRRPRLWLAAVGLAGAATFTKPMIGPLVVLALAAVVAEGRGVRALLRRGPAGALAAVAAPTVGYFVYGRLTGAGTESWLGSSFVPSLLTEASFYRTWLDTIDRAVPLGLLALAVVGVAVAGGQARAVLGAALVGHALMGVVVSYRSATHDYYHLPLVALAALGLGVAAHTAVDRVRATSWSPPRRRAVLGVGAALLVVTGAAFATGTRALEPPIGTAAHHVAANREIGELTGHSRRVLALTPTYGADLAFDGRVVVREYPDASEAALMEARGLPVPTPAEVIADTGAEWFAVTNLGALRELPALEAELATHHELVASGDGWRLWRLGG